MKFESLAQKVEREMREKGKVVDLSKKASQDIDSIGYNSGFDKIQQEFQQKERASRAYISDVESGRVNFYKKESAYSKIKKYLSSLGSIFK